MIRIPSRVVHLEFLINLPPPTETDLMRKQWVEMISEGAFTMAKTEMIYPKNVGAEVAMHLT